MSLTTGPVPKYFRLADWLRQQIRDGILQPGDQLPTEAALCERFGVSRGTVRQAIQLLVQEGLVQREQGRGTFVREPMRRAFFTLTGFKEDMRRQGIQPETRLLIADVVPATSQVAERLAISEGTPVIHIERQHLAHGRPILYDKRLLAQALCPELLQDDLANASIHELLIEKYRIPLLRTVHIMEVHLLDEREAALLDAAVGTPAFFVDRLTYTTGPDGERPAVWYQALYRGDAYHFRAEFEAHISTDASRNERP